jgi:hypothetical protein
VVSRGRRDKGACGIIGVLRTAGDGRPEAGIGFARDAVGSKSVLAVVQVALFGLSQYGLYTGMHKVVSIDRLNALEAASSAQAWSSCEARRALGQAARAGNCRWEEPQIVLARARAMRHALLGGLDPFLAQGSTCVASGLASTSSVPRKVCVTAGAKPGGFALPLRRYNALRVDFIRTVKRTVASPRAVFPSMDHRPRTCSGANYSMEIRGCG